MGKQGNQFFYRLYVVYGFIFLLLCVGIIVCCVTDFYVLPLVPICLALMALAILFFVFSIKKGVLQIFTECNQVLDQAIEGEELIPLNEETELALFQTKLAKFVDIRNRGVSDNKEQKEKIEGLLADISHQTKTPIANILLYSQLLKEKAPAGSQLYDYAEKLTVQSEKLKGLVQALVEMSRLENGIIICVSKQENLNDLLLQIIGDFYEKSQAKEIELTLDCPPELTAFFDWKWLREAVGNVVDNGIKYTPEGGRIDISVIPYELFIRIDIADTGMGISPEEITRIFGRFYRSPAVSKSEGLGLGLYLAREMLTAQRGYMKVLTAPGKGSVFHIFIPKTA